MGHSWSMPRPKLTPARKEGRPRRPAPSPGPEGRAARQPLLRMMRIHRMLQTGDFPNCQVLSHVFEVSYKTIQRDIDFMRDQLGLPIDYDTVEHGFHYTREVTEFPTLLLEEGEIFALLVAQKAAEQYRGTPFEKALGSAFSKLVAGLPSRSEISLQDLSQALSFRPAGPRVDDLSAFQTIGSALFDSHELSFRYRKPGDGEGAERRVQPYHLGCIAGQWYLIGLDLGRNAVRTFALARITRLKNLKRRFERPKDFSLDTMLSESFSAFESTNPQLVRILFDPVAAALVSERKWHPSQKLTPRRDGSAELTMKVGLAPDLESWILGWGPRAEVLAPAALRRSVAGAHGRAALKYRP